MNEQDAIREQLWDLVYGLLEPDEKAALHARIKSDPQVARMYADTMLEADLLAKASAVEIPPVEFTVPRDKVSVAKRGTSVKPGSAAASSLSRGLNWLAGMGATALALLIVVMLARPETARLPAAATAKLLEVSGAPQWQPGISNWVKVVARAADGTPESVDLQIAVEDPQGHVNYYQQVRTNEAGEAQLEIPGEAVKHGNRLQVQYAERGDETKWKEMDGAVLSAPLPAQAEAQRATVTLDRDWYEPGAALRFRTSVLGARSLEAPASSELHYEVTTPDGKPLAEATGAVVATNGVAAAQIKLPPDAPEGHYHLRVKGEDAAGASDAADFLVRQRPPTAPADPLADVKKKRDTLGDQVTGKAVDSPKALAGAAGFGGGLGGARMRLEKEVAKSRQSSTLESKSKVEELSKGQGEAAGGTERLSASGASPPVLAKDRGRLSGELGLPREAAPEEATLGQLAQRDKERFQTPAVPENHRYLKMTLPAEHAGKKLKVVVTDSRGEVLQTVDSVAKVAAGTSVVANGEMDAKFGDAKESKLYRAEPAAAGSGTPAATNAQAATTRGASDGRKDPVATRNAPARALEDVAERSEAGVALGDGTRAAEVELRLAPEVQGQVQTYAVDVSSRSPRVVGHDSRFVPAEKELAIHFDDFTSEYAAGDKVTLSLRITDEAQQPASNVVLGVRVVDEVALQATPEAETLAARWGLQVPASGFGSGLGYGMGGFNQEAFFARGGEQLRRGLSRATEELRDGEAALDKVTELAAKDASGVEADKQLGNADFGEIEPAEVLAYAETADRVLASNRDAVEASVQRSDFVRFAQQTVDYRFAGQVLITGAALLACLAAVAYGLRLRPSTPVWMPAIAMCGVSLVVGLMWIERASPRHAIIARAPAPAGAPQATHESDEYFKQAESTKTDFDSAAMPAQQEGLSGIDDDVRMGRSDPQAELPRWRKSVDRAAEGLKDRFANDAEYSPGNAPKSQPQEPADRAPESSRTAPGGGQGSEGRAKGLQRSFGMPSSRSLSELEEVQRAKQTAADEKTLGESAAEKSSPAKPEGGAKAANELKPLASGVGRSVRLQPEPQIEKPAADAPAAAPAPAATPTPATSSFAAPAPKAVEDSFDRGADKRPVAKKPSDAMKIVGQKAAGQVAGEPRPDGLGAKREPLAEVPLDDSAPAHSTPDYVLLWEPVMVTDENGTASFTFTLPLRTARYRIFVDAQGRGRIGSAVAALVAQTPEKPDPAKAESKQ